jgi:hypothetical protein
LDPVPFVGPQEKWLDYSLKLYRATMVLSILFMSIPLWRMYHEGLAVAFGWSLFVVLPLLIFAWYFWWRLELRIRANMKIYFGSPEGPLQCAVPHHGVLFVVAIKFLFALALWAGQIMCAICENMGTGAIVFGIGNVVTNFLIIASVLVLWQVEEKVRIITETRAV